MTQQRFYGIGCRRMVTRQVGFVVGSRHRWIVPCRMGHWRPKMSGDFFVSAAWRYVAQVVIEPLAPAENHRSWPRRNGMQITYVFPLKGWKRSITLVRPPIAIFCPKSVQRMVIGHLCDTFGKKSCGNDQSPLRTIRGSDVIKLWFGNSRFWNGKYI